MASMIQTLGIDLEQLTVDQRLQLLDEIWDTVAASPDQLPLGEDQRQDLERRLAAYATDPRQGDAADAVMARLRGRA